MATIVIMPRQGNTVESCIIGKWHKKKGDLIQVGNILFTYETDKAAFDEEATVSGTLLEIFFQEGDDVPVLAPVCIIGNPEEDVTGLFPGKVSQKEKAAALPKEAKPDLPLSEKTDSGETRISPRARALAGKKGLDIFFAVPSGPEGRIVERDIVALEQTHPGATPAARESMKPGTDQIGTGIGGRITVADLARDRTAADAEPEYRDEPLTQIRKIIGSTMHRSLSEMAQLTMNRTFDATGLLKFRQEVKARGTAWGIPNITINDVIIYVVSRMLSRHGDLNAHFLGDYVRKFRNVHMGIAVDTERGLMVPTLRFCNQMSLRQISDSVRNLAGQCKEGNVNPDLLRGSTFTITTLGVMGVESFTPVINPPQTAILGVCCVMTRWREDGGKPISYPSMNLSLTIDHRVVDGAPAARFLQDLCDGLESFQVMLI